MYRRAQIARDGSVLHYEASSILLTNIGLGILSSAHSRNCFSETLKSMASYSETSITVTVKKFAPVAYMMMAKIKRAEIFNGEQLVYTRMRTCANTVFLRVFFVFLNTKVATVLHKIPSEMPYRKFCSSKTSRITAVLRLHVREL